MTRQRTNGGRLLLLLASRDAKSVAQLSTASGLSPAETLRQLQQLSDRGFVVIRTEAGVTVYQLNPKGMRTEALAAHQRILVVEDNAAVQFMVAIALEAEGYTVTLCTTQLDAMTLLREVSFDLIITDGFSQTPGAVFTTTAALRAAAGVTPIALFSAHKLALDATQVAGFAALIEKPFQLETLEEQIRTLLRGHRLDQPK